VSRSFFIDQSIKREVAEGKYVHCKWSRLHFHHNTGQEVTLRLDVDVSVQPEIFDQLLVVLTTQSEPVSDKNPNSILYWVNKVDERPAKNDGESFGGYLSIDQTNSHFLNDIIEEICKRSFPIRGQDSYLKRSELNGKGDSFGFFVRNTSIRLVFQFDVCDKNGRVIDRFQEYAARKVRINIHVTSGENGASTMQDVIIKLKNRLEQFQRGFFDNHFSAIQDLDEPPFRRKNAQVRYGEKRITYFQVQPEGAK